MLATILAVGAADMVAQSPSPRAPLLEVTGGAGYTIVDQAKWAPAANDWSEVGYRVGLRVLFPGPGRLMLGVEAAYHYVYWYELGPAYSYASYDLAPTVLGGVARLPVGDRLRLDVGLAAYMFESFTDIGPNVGLAYFIRAGERLNVIIQPRVDLIIDSDGNAIPLSVNAGLSYRLR